MNDKQQQLDALNELLKSGLLNCHQTEVIERLMWATKHDTEDHLAAYISTMDQSAVNWAANNLEMMGLL